MPRSMQFAAIREGRFDEWPIGGRTGVFLTDKNPAPEGERVVVVEVPDADQYARGPDHPGD